LICDEEIVFITELVIWWECNLNLKPADHKIGRPELSIRHSFYDALYPVSLASHCRRNGNSTENEKSRSRECHVGGSGNPFHGKAIATSDRTRHSRGPSFRDLAADAMSDISRDCGAAR
jgi:hypothetical protein